MINDGFVFRANHISIPVGFIRILLIQEAHGGGGTFRCKEDGRYSSNTFLLAKNEARY